MLPQCCSVQTSCSLPASSYGGRLSVSIFDSHQDSTVPSTASNSRAGLLLLKKACARWKDEEDQQFASVSNCPGSPTSKSTRSSAFAGGRCRATHSCRVACRVKCGDFSTFRCPESLYDINTNSHAARLRFGRVLQAGFPNATHLRTLSSQDAALWPKPGPDGSLATLRAKVEPFDHACPCGLHGHGRVVLEYHTSCKVTVAGPCLFLVHRLFPGIPRGLPPAAGMADSCGALALGSDLSLRA